MPRGGAERGAPRGLSRRYSDPGLGRSFRLRDRVANNIAPAAPVSPKKREKKKPIPGDPDSQKGAAGANRPHFQIYIYVRVREREKGSDDESGFEKTDSKLVAGAIVAGSLLRAPAAEAYRRPFSGQGTYRRPGCQAVIPGHLLMATRRIGSTLRAPDSPASRNRTENLCPGAGGHRPHPADLISCR